MGLFRKRTIDKRRFKLEGFGAKKKGTQLLTRVGFGRVYKEVRADKKFSATAGKDIIQDTLMGQEFLRDSGLPITRYQGKVVIRGKERLVFDKARRIGPDELNNRLKEIISVIKEANRKGVYFDAKLENFGINVKGKIVIRDTNAICAAKGEKALSAMIRDLEEELNPMNVHHREVQKKLKKLRTNLNLIQEK